VNILDLSSCSTVVGRPLHSCDARSCLQKKALLVQRSRTNHGDYNIDQVVNPTLSVYKSKDRIPFSSTAGIFAVSNRIRLAFQLAC
jgi:hypothetical protein